MKRLDSPDSLGALMSICPNSTDELKQEGNPIYGSDQFETALDGFDEEGCVEQSNHVSEKKRRLSVDQVKALEKNFEVENKLEPERKVKLAREIGLQPRQVAVWFQNRRARYKTKQLERDYGILKASYDNLKHNYDAVQHHNEALLKEIREMKSKLGEDEQNGRKESVKEEAMASDDEEKSSKLESQIFGLDESAADGELNAAMEGGSMFLDFKDGSSDSTDSSAILYEENGCGPVQFMEIRNCAFLQISDSKASVALGEEAHHEVKYQQQQCVKIEEHNFLDEESCSSLFSDDQAPTLQWYCSDHWN